MEQGDVMYGVSAHTRPNSSRRNFSFVRIQSGVYSHLNEQEVMSLDWMPADDYIAEFQTCFDCNDLILIPTSPLLLTRH